LEITSLEVISSRSKTNWKTYTQQKAFKSF